MTRSTWFLSGMLALAACGSGAAAQPDAAGTGADASPSPDAAADAGSPAAQGAATAQQDAASAAPDASAPACTPAWADAYRVALATSTDGLAFEKRGLTLELTEAGTEAWSTRDPAVLRTAEGWLMACSGMGDGRYRLFRATSTTCAPAGSLSCPA